MDEAGQEQIYMNGEISMRPETANDVPQAGNTCLLYTSDAADDLLCVDLGGRRIIKKKNYKSKYRVQSTISTHTSTVPTIYLNSTVSTQHHNTSID